MVNFKELEEEGYFITIDGKRSKSNTKSIRNGKQKNQKIQLSGEQ